MTDKVLLVEDDAALRRSISQALSYEGITVIEASAVIVAKDYVAVDFGGVILTDIRMDGRDGFDLLAHVQTVDAELPVIMLTGHGDIPMAVRAMQNGAHDFLEKPCHPEVILKSVKQALKQRQLIIENRKLTADLSEQDVVARRFPGKSPIIQTFRHDLRKVSKLPVNVHLWGEHGVGKSMSASCIAHLAHHGVTPPDQNLSACTKDNFAQFPGESLVIFRNVDAASQEQQDMLVSFINASPETRIVSTSNRHLDEALGEGLNKSLYFLIGVVQLEVPPLRSRPQDVLPTFRGLLSEQANILQLAQPKLSPDTLRDIFRHNWPGNIAELRQFATKVALGLKVTAPPSGTLSLSERLQAYEKSMLVDAMRRHKGRSSDIADDLKIPLKTLYDKLKRFELKGSQFR